MKKALPPPPPPRKKQSQAAALPARWLLLAAVALMVVALAPLAGCGRALVFSLPWRAGGGGSRVAATPAPCAVDGVGAGGARPYAPSSACWPGGEGCPAAALEAANSQLAPILADLVRTPFFRYFKVSLTCGCPFWREGDGMCALQDCAVCECPDADVPPAFTAAERDGAPPAEHGSCRRLGRLADFEVDGGPGPADPAALAADPDVDRWVDAPTRARLVSVRGWKGIDNPWMAGGDGGGGDREYTYIDLTKNPERFTGYTGPAARRVWDFIYSQACFAGAAPGVASESGSGGSGSGSGDDGAGLPVCGDAPARTTFFRIMSGVHASITAHIAADYLMDERARAWGPNLGLYAERLGGPANSWRRSNLRFAHAFVARAVAVAGPLLEAADYRVGGSGGGGGGGAGDGDGAAEHRLVRALLSSPGLAAVCGAPWDGAKALARDGGGGDGAAAAPLTAGMAAAFRNVTAVLDCVGCEKCRLWGKLQLLGVATALKVLVADAEAGVVEGGGPPRPPLTLERNEAVALVNLFDRLARSVRTVAAFEARLEAGEVPAPVVTLADGGGDGGGGEGLGAALGFSG